MSGTLKKLTGILKMMRSPLALLVALLPLSVSVSAQTIYKCIDASGGTVISNSRVGPTCKELTTAPELALGNSKAKVLSVAGEPSRKSISKKRGLVRELWFYGDGTTLVFENGVVVEMLSNE